jgi:ribokinase
VPQAVVLGDINLDMIAHISHYPSPGGDGVADALWLTSGGSAANTARVLASCGISAGLIGRVGSDALSGPLLDELCAAGVDVSQVQRDLAVPSGMMFITVTPDGQRTMFGYRGANVHTDPQDLEVETVRAADWLHVSGYALLASPQAEATLCALNMAVHAGLYVSVDPGLEVVLRQPARVDSLLASVDALLPNGDEAQKLVGSIDPEEAIVRLRQRGISTVALKRGEKGCVLGATDELCHVPAFAIHAVDTTGAGDAFAGGFIAGQLHGLSLRACGLWANAMGALAASVIGSGTPTRETIPPFLHEHAGHPQWAGWKKEFDVLLALLENVP